MNKVITYILLFLCSSVKCSFGQGLIWQQQLDATFGNVKPIDLAVGSDGSVVSLAYRSGASEYSILSKFSSSGTLLWERRLGDLSQYWYYDMSIDFQGGSIYLVGTITGADIFIAKYDINGSYIWMKVFDASQGRPISINVDNLGNVYVFGDSGQVPVDFDPSTNDTFFSKYFLTVYNTNGDFLRGFELPVGNGFSINSLNEIIVWGGFSGSVDFDPGPGSNIKIATTPNLFIAKYNSSNQLIWVRNMERTPSSYIRDISVDNTGSLIVVGETEALTDFDPGPGSKYLPTNGVDIFYAKYNQVGDYVFAYNFGNSQQTSVEDVCVGPDGSIFITGTIVGTVDLDPDTNNEFNLSSYTPTKYAGFLSKYTTNGTFQTAVREFDIANRVEINTFGNIVTQGQIPNSVQINKRCFSPPIITISQPQPNTICIGGTGSTFTVSGAFTYSIEPFYGIVGRSGTTYTVNPSQTTTYTVQGTDIEGCRSSASVTVNVNSINPGSISSNRTTCGPVDGSAFTQVAATGSGSISYQWQSALDGINFSDIVGATSAVYDPPIIYQNTSFKRIATSSIAGLNCLSSASIVSVTVLEATSGGTVGSDQSLCKNGDPVELTQLSSPTGFGSLAYRWESSIDGVNFVDIPSGGTGMNYNPPLLAQSGWYKRRAIFSVSSPISCTRSAVSNVIKITVNPVTSGTIGSDQYICAGGDPSAFFQSVAPVGVSLTYKWQSSLDNLSFSDINGATSSLYDPPAGVNQTTYFRRVVSNVEAGTNCSATSKVVITVNTVSGGVVNSSQSICTGQIPTALTVSGGTGLGSLAFKWQKSTDGNVFSDISGATSASYSFQSSPLQTTHYRRVTTSTYSLPCAANSSVAIITINPIPQLTNTLPATIQICSGQATNYSFTSSVSGTTFSYTPTTTNVSGASAGSGNTLSQTLTTSTNPYGTVVYAVTPVFSGCSGTTKNLTYVVNRYGSGSIIQSGDICTDGFVTLTAGSGTNYAWNTGVTTQAITGGVGSYSVTYLANSCTSIATDEVASCPPPQCPDPYNPNCPCVGPNCARKRPEVEQPVEFTTLGIFPNPVDEALMIHIEEPATTRLEIAMVSQFGSRVRGSAIEKGSSKANLDVKDLAEGMYIVTVLAETGYVLRQKVVVIHTQ